MSALLDISPSVQKHINQGGPIVALESTIISHGMPYPRNVETALQVEKSVTSTGAVPATIALIGGKIKIGLSESEIDHLGRATGVTKVSRRDMASVLTRKSLGATTVAATMIGANLAGIDLFATGGIGGVHRQGHETFDISADLLELGRTPVAVVCAGAKSILDIPRTLEYLETQGVVTLGMACDNFPAFYTTDSGEANAQRVETPQQAAEVIAMQKQLGLQTGLLIANPIPRESALDESLINLAIEQALLEAEQKGIRGKQVTPFLLSAIVKATEGKSLEANIALINHNAITAGLIAVAMSQR